MKAEELEALVNNLPPEEQAGARELLEKLGDALVYDETPTKKTAVEKLKPYYLVLDNSCHLCKSVTRTFFYMKENASGGLSSKALVALPDNTESLGVKQETKASLTCSRCCEELGKWSKADLVSALIKAKGGR